MLATIIRQEKTRAKQLLWFKRTYLTVISLSYLSLIILPSVGLFAQSTIETTESEANSGLVAPTLDPAKQGPQEPTGPENNSYTYNELTGLWENEFYTWDPVTKKTAPKTDQTYSYNPKTEKWDGDYVYSAEQQKYIKPSTTSTNNLPAPEVKSTNNTTTNSLPSTGSKPEIKNTTKPLVTNNTTDLPTSKLSVESLNSTSGAFDLFFNADISIDVDTKSTSGDASVIQNTNGGDALSGDARSEAYMINIIQSLLGTTGTLPEFYTANINGDYFGDLMIDPDLLINENTISNNNANLEVNVLNDIDLEVNVNLIAESGDAVVSQNTNGGNATSGNADAVANIVNMINSSIASNQSFFGVLNVHGDLNGDVLFADDLMEQLIAANVPTSNLIIGRDVDIDTSFKNNVNIDDNIVATASSGDAEVSSNTSAGDATSGSADTNVTVFNLIGHNVSAENALLVFVNVSGEWVGFITNAPTNSTAAAFGSGVEYISQNNIDADFEIENDVSITNNINVQAQTGDATVNQNTSAGNATSGDASAIASVSNIVNTNFLLGGWFNLLFINIFGNWCGSVGTDTDCGNQALTQGAIASNNSDYTGVNRGGINSIPAPITTPDPSSIRIFSASLVTSQPNNNDDSQEQLVLAEATEINITQDSKQNYAAPNNTSSSQIKGWMLVTFAAISYLVIFQGGRIIDLLRRN